jgi:hypothetical protein
MSQNHYVAQTYLEKWCDPTNRDHLHVYRKSNLKYFPARPYDVCREKDGDRTPGYLADESALGNFRARFEPTWNQALAAAVQRRITEKDKFFISGYWANLTATTPTTQALGVDLHKREVEALAAVVQKDYPPPESIAGLGLRAEVDPVFVKAVATQSLLANAWQFYNQSWSVFSDDTSHPFITSDNPSALVPAPPGLPSLRCLPLCPHLCIVAEMKSLVPVPNAPDLSHLTKPPFGVIRYGPVANDQARKLNRAVAVTAFDLVFSCKADRGIARLVEKYRNAEGEPNRGCGSHLRPALFCGIALSSIKAHGHMAGRRSVSKMPLDHRLMRALLSHSCPYCGTKRTMKGSWFTSKAGYTCTGCRKLVAVTYGDKVALFDRHAHLVRPM